MSESEAPKKIKYKRRYEKNMEKKLKTQQRGAKSIKGREAKQGRGEERENEEDEEDEEREEAQLRVSFSCNFHLSSGYGSAGSSAASELAAFGLAV